MTERYQNKEYSLYESILGPFEKNTLLRYYINSWDNTNNTSVSSLNGINILPPRDITL